MKDIENYNDNSPILGLIVLPERFNIKPIVQVQENEKKVLTECKIEKRS